MSKELLITDDQIVYPRPGGKGGILEMTVVSQAIKCIPEVETVSKSRAPRLLAIFNKGYADLNKKVVFVRYEANRAENLADQRAAVVLLDLSGGIIKAKGQNPTKELREAVVTMDSEFQELTDNVAMLKALLKHLEGELKSLDMAYMSVKKIYDNTNRPFLEEGCDMENNNG